MAVESKLAMSAAERALCRQFSVYDEKDKSYFLSRLKWAAEDFAVEADRDDPTLMWNIRSEGAPAVLFAVAVKPDNEFSQTLRLALVRMWTTHITDVSGSPLFTKAEILRARTQTYLLDADFHRYHAMVWANIDLADAVILPQSTTRALAVPASFLGAPAFLTCNYRIVNRKAEAF